MSRLGLLIAAVIVAVTMLLLWFLGDASPSCGDGRVAVMGEGKWYCVEGTEVPTRAGG